MTNRKEQLELAKLAEQAERYPDMVNAMKEIVELDSELTENERNHFSVAYKNVISNYRASWRVLASIDMKSKSSGREREIIEEYREMIENEIKDLCHEVLSLLDRYLIPKAKTAETKVFYWKMKGDYYRYLAEIIVDNEREKVVAESERAYKNGLDIAKDQMPVTHPSRLGLVLNFSVFLHEILEDTDAACRLAKQAFDDALAELDSAEANSHRDSTIIMQLLRDNVTLWNNEQSELNHADQSEEEQ